MTAITVVVETSKQITNVVATQNVTRVSVSGMRGPAGPAGEESAGATLSFPASASIHAGRAVRLVGGELSHPSTSNADHAGQVAGVSETAATAGASARFRTAGVTDNVDWSWAEGPVFVGDDGVLTQTAPAAGWLMIIGRALTATSLLVDIEPPIYRS